MKPHWISSPQIRTAPRIAGRCVRNGVVYDPVPLSCAKIEREPDGYLKGEGGNLVIDEETAPIVEMIFQLCLEGNGPGKIARILTEREIKTPGTVRFERTGQTHLYHPDAPCSWASDTVADILDQDAYLGRTRNFKTTRLSYKSKKQVRNPPEKQITLENTHEAIIDIGTWELVRKIREQRRRSTKMGDMGLFSGMVYCADCGQGHYLCRSTSWTHEQECYTCSTYRCHRGCSAHYIRAVVLEQLVLQNLQRVVAYAQDDEDEFIRQVMENKMELQKSCAALRKIVDAAQSETINIQSFLKIVRRYTEPTELTPSLLREFVDKIVVHEADKSSGHRVQRIDIHYNFIGEIDFSPEYNRAANK